MVDAMGEECEQLTAGERAALAAAENGPNPVAGDLRRESPYEHRRDAGRGGEEEDPRERQLRRERRGEVKE